MLYLNRPAQRVEWPAAGISLDLVPLRTGDRQRFDAETTTWQHDEAGKPVRVVHDQLGYAQRVGRACIKGWSGVVGTDGQPAACTPEAIDELMAIGPAADFVLLKVEGLGIHLAEQRAAAGNG